MLIIIVEFAGINVRIHLLLRLLLILLTRPVCRDAMILTSHKIHQTSALKIVLLPPLLTISVDIVWLNVLTIPRATETHNSIFAPMNA